MRDPAAAFPLPSVRDDAQDRRAGAVSAAGLAATGVIELLLAVITGSVGLLGDAIHHPSESPPAPCTSTGSASRPTR